MLKELLTHKKKLIFIESHSPLSAHIVESVSYTNGAGQRICFDGIWSSSLSDSMLNGLPDTE